MSAFLDDARFRQSFTTLLTVGQQGQRSFTITFADYGYRNITHPEEEIVLLIFGSLTASRLLHVAKDELAKTHKVRIISPDRPGFGGTDQVDVESRMQLWTEAVPLLLKHLSIPHVSLLCHSGGVVYGLDLLLHHPEVLHPEKPYIAIGAPWISPSHTNSTLMSIVQHLPSPILRQTDKVAKAVNNHVGPLIGRTIGVSQMLLRADPGPQPQEGEQAADPAALEASLWTEIMSRMYAEDVRGLSSEALLLMRKGQASGWSDWGDYDTSVPRLADLLRRLDKKLSVDAFYSEQDALIGDSTSPGIAWFDQFWKAELCEGIIDYHATTVPGADHDHVWDMKHGAIQAVLERVGQFRLP